MFVNINKPFLTIFLVVFCSQILSARDQQGQNYSEKNNTVNFSTNADSIYIPPVKWPTYVGGQETDKFRTLYDCFGHIGAGFSYQPGIIQFQNIYGSSYSFESPPKSRIEYLFGGAIWVGAVVGNDTLVSTSADGWQVGFEEFGGRTVYTTNPNLKKIKFPSDYSLRCEFTDTNTANIPPDYMSGMEFQPLHIKVINRSHVWRNDPLDNAVIYDYVITNIGDQQLENVYLGFYFDCDVG